MMISDEEGAGLLIPSGNQEATTALMASLLVLPSATLAFVCPATTNNAAVTLATPTRSFQTTTMAMSLLDQEESTNADTSPTVSRRSFWQQAAFLTAVVATATPPVALAKAPAVSQEDADKAKLKKGYDRLTFLLDNWEKETTVCKTGTDSPFTGCDRTPIKVMEVSTLFCFSDERGEEEEWWRWSSLWSLWWWSWLVCFFRDFDSEGIENDSDQENCCPCRGGDGKRRTLFQVGRPKQYIQEV